MRAVLQRVSSASVRVDSRVVGAIGPGLVVLLGVGEGDGEADAVYLAEKTAGLRIFEDEAGKMNRSLREINAEALIVSQFTLYGDCRKGRRPGFSAAAPPDVADTLYRFYVRQLETQGIGVATGVFQAHMQVALVNDGPVTMLLDSRKEF